LRPVKARHASRCATDLHVFSTASVGPHHDVDARVAFSTRRCIPLHTTVFEFAILALHDMT
jgi:hypothetical protein